MFFIKSEQKWHVVLVVCEVHSTVTSLASFWKQLLLDYYFVFIYLATILSFSALKDKLKMKILPLSPPPMPIYNCLKFHTLQNIFWASQLNSEAAFFWTKQQIQKTTWKKKTENVSIKFIKF